jgi:hypothetical protein
VVDHAITGSDGATVVGEENTPVIAATRTQARPGTAGTAATAAVARIAIEVSAAKAVSAVRALEQKAAAEVVATEVVRVTVRRAAAAIARDRAARGAMSRTLAPIRARVAIRAAGPIRAVASIRVDDLTRRLVGTRNQTPVLAPIRAGARTRVCAQTRTPGLIRRVVSTLAHAATKMAARIKVDGSIRVRAANRPDAPIKTVGRTKALCATISATALQRAPVPRLTVTALVAAVTDQSAAANAVAAEDAVAADAVVAVEAKAVTGTVHRRAEHPAALARRLPGQRTRLLRKPRRYRRVTVPIGTKAPATKAPGIMRTLDTNRHLKRLANGRTIARRLNRSDRLNRTGPRNRSTRRRSLNIASRRLHPV